MPVVTISRMYGSGGSEVAQRVAVYTHRDVERYWASLARERIHRADTLELCGIAGAPLATLVARLERRTMFDLSVAEDVMYLTIAGEIVEGPVGRAKATG